MSGATLAASELTLTGNNLSYVIIAAVIALVALGFAAGLVRAVLATGKGTQKMQEIAGAVQEGASAYLFRQFKTLGVFVIIAVVLLFLLPVNEGGAGVRIGRSVFFVVGAVFSAFIGGAGMALATRANVRVAAAANTGEGARERAMQIAFRTGGVVGFLTVGLGLLGAAVVVLIYQGDAPTVLEGFGFGAALLAMFMRVGGGIFTKAADVGADLVGKVEQGIPEDDPRNAAVIADNVGDNVGDCAGMAADLFESYEVTLVAALILGAAAFIAKGPTAAIIGVTFPLFVRAIGVVTSIIGIYMVSPRSETEHGMRAINRGFFVSAALSAVAVLAVAHWYAHNIRDFYAVLIGLALSAVIQVLTQHFTDTTRAPVQEIAKASNTGAATTILSGFSVGMESTVWALLAVAAAIMGAFLLGHGIDEKLYYIALSGMGMLTTVGVSVSMDTYGPISD